MKTVITLVAIEMVSIAYVLLAAIDYQGIAIVISAICSGIAAIYAAQAKIQGDKNAGHLVEVKADVSVVKTDQRSAAMDMGITKNEVATIHSVVNSHTDKLDAKVETLTNRLVEKTTTLADTVSKLEEKTRAMDVVKTELVDANQAAAVAKAGASKSPPSPTAAVAPVSDAAGPAVRPLLSAVRETTEAVRETTAAVKSERKS